MRRTKAANASAKAVHAFCDISATSTFGPSFGGLQRHCRGNTLAKQACRVAFADYGTRMSYYSQPEASRHLDSCPSRITRYGAIRKVVGPSILPGGGRINGLPRCQLLLKLLRLAPHLVDLRLCVAVEHLGRFAAEPLHDAGFGGADALLNPPRKFLEPAQPRIQLRRELGQLLIGGCGDRRCDGTHRALGGVHASRELVYHSDQHQGDTYGGETQDSRKQQVAAQRFQAAYQYFHSGRRNGSGLLSGACGI